MDALEHLASRNLPRIRSVAWYRPLIWLLDALEDMGRSPSLSLAWGSLFSLGGLLCYQCARERPSLVLASLAAYLVVAPLLAVVFYQISRLREGREGKGTDLTEARLFAPVLARWQPLALFGLLLAALFLFWSQITALLAMEALDGNGAGPLGAVWAQLWQRQDTGPLLLWGLSSLLLGLLAFACGVVTAPYLLEREGDVGQAVAASLQACLQNLPAMGVWLVAILALSALGFATLMLGFTMVAPLMGYATWRAYRELVE